MGFFFPLLLFSFYSLFFHFLSSLSFSFSFVFSCRCPAILPSPSSCFCFSNPCSWSQEESRRDESPAVVCWEAGGKPGASGGQSHRGLWGTTALRNKHTVKFENTAKNYNQRNRGWKVPFNFSASWTPHSLKILSNRVKSCGPPTGSFAHWLSPSILLTHLLKDASDPVSTMKKSFIPNWRTRWTYRSPKMLIPTPVL